MDVIIFCGQSNMEGSTGTFPTEPGVPGAWEYRQLGDELIPLCHPVGERIGEGLLSPADSGNGSLLPAFCREYVRKTGREVVAVHAARGATAIGEWEKGTARFDALIEKAKGALRAAEAGGKVDRVLFVWLQGESDACRQTGTETYLAKLLQFKNDVKAEIPISRFAIIRVGYFAAYADWIERPVRDKRRSDRAIMRAQELAVRRDPDFAMLTRCTSRLSLRKKYLNEKEHGPHYNNEGMIVIGKKAGAAAAGLFR